MALRQKTRLKPNLVEMDSNTYRENIIGPWLHQRQTRSMMKLCEPLMSLGWKQAPKPWVLDDFSDLWELVLALEPKAILSDSYLRQAIMDEHAKD